MSFLSRLAGDSATPSTDTASPRSNPTSITVARSGASSGLSVRWNTASSGSSAGSSSSLPSEELCSRFASTLNGASPRLSFAIGIWCVSANSISLVRLVRSHSRQGAITRTSGLSA